MNMEDNYIRLIDSIKQTMDSVDGKNIVILDINAFAMLLSSYLKDNFINKSKEEIINDLTK